MPGPLSEDLRKRVVEAHLEGGKSTKEVAKQFEVGTASVKRWARRYRERGDVKPDKLGGVRDRLIDAERLESLGHEVEDDPDRTQEEFVDAYEARTGIRVSRSTMARALKRAGYTRKKSPSEPPSGPVAASNENATSGKSSSES